MPLTLERIKAHMAQFEGSVSHMYLDTVGKVTVGIGNMLPSVAKAQELNFIDRQTHAKATAEQIAGDYAAVLKQPHGLLSTRYRPCTRLDLPPGEIDALFGKRVQEFEGELRIYYSKYDGFPDSAKLALLDMAFNLGSAGLHKEWPRLNAAIGSCDWRAAALECRRPQVQAPRNAGTKELFELASNETGVATQLA